MRRGDILRDIGGCDIVFLVLIVTMEFVFYAISGFTSVETEKQVPGSLSFADKAINRGGSHLQDPGLCEFGLEKTAMARAKEGDC